LEKKKKSALRDKISRMRLNAPVYILSAGRKIKALRGKVGKGNRKALLPAGSSNSRRAPRGFQLFSTEKAAP
jgi:hypothetical protein